MMLLDFLLHSDMRGEAKPSEKCPQSPRNGPLARFVLKPFAHLNGAYSGFLTARASHGVR
jgi:hypothetical protein